MTYSAKHLLNIPTWPKQGWHFALVLLHGYFKLLDHKPWIFLVSAIGVHVIFGYMLMLQMQPFVNGENEILALVANVPVTILATVPLVVLEFINIALFCNFFGRLPLFRRLPNIKKTVENVQKSLRYFRKISQHLARPPKQ